ncbi:MAG: uroporphyrinogen-III synthase [Alphaproteobacteria bacterium]
MTKTVLITRARGDENEFTEALHELNLNVIHEPMTDILLIHTARTELEQALSENPSAVLLTSRHGARALAALSTIRDLPLLCVGESTGKIAESLGFTRVTVTGQDVDGMIDYILSAYDDEASFVYPSAEHIRTDLGEALAPHGMQTVRVVAYEARQVDGLSDTLSQHLRQGHVDVVTFLSARTASIFEQLVGNAGIAAQLAKMTACCMSEAIAAQLDTGLWRTVVSADQPTLASLALCVDNACNDRRKSG